MAVNEALVQLNFRSKNSSIAHIEEETFPFNMLRNVDPTARTDSPNLAQRSPECTPVVKLNRKDSSAVSDPGDLCISPSNSAEVQLSEVLAKPVDYSTHSRLHEQSTVQNGTLPYPNISSSSSSSSPSSSSSASFSSIHGHANRPPNQTLDVNYEAPSVSHKDPSNVHRESSQMCVPDDFSIKQVVSRSEPTDSHCHRGPIKSIPECTLRRIGRSEAKNAAKLPATTTAMHARAHETNRSTIRCHPPGTNPGSTGSKNGVTPAAYKFLTWREKDRRRRFREEWKHLWLVVPHGRYEVMCLVCHKVMTQRKLDTIKRHTVRRHVELLSMAEADRQDLYEQLVRQCDLASANSGDHGSTSCPPSHGPGRKVTEPGHSLSGKVTTHSNFNWPSTGSRVGQQSRIQNRNEKLNWLLNKPARTTGMTALANGPVGHRGPYQAQTESTRSRSNKPSLQCTYSNPAFRNPQLNPSDFPLIPPHHLASMESKDNPGPARSIPYNATCASSTSVPVSMIDNRNYAWSTSKTTPTDFQPIKGNSRPAFHGHVNSTQSLANFFPPSSTSSPVSGRLNPERSSTQSKTVPMNLPGVGSIKAPFDPSVFEKVMSYLLAVKDRQSVLPTSVACSSKLENDEPTRTRSRFDPTMTSPTVASIRNSTSQYSTGIGKAKLDSECTRMPVSFASVSIPGSKRPAENPDLNGVPGMNQTGVSSCTSIPPIYSSTNSRSGAVQPAPWSSQFWPPKMSNEFPFSPEMAPLMMATWMAAFTSTGLSNHDSSSQKFPHSTKSPILSPNKSNYATEGQPFAPYAGFPPPFLPFHPPVGQHRTTQHPWTPDWRGLGLPMPTNLYRSRESAFSASSLPLSTNSSAHMMPDLLTVSSRICSPAGSSSIETSSPRFSYRGSFYGRSEPGNVAPLSSPGNNPVISVAEMEHHMTPHGRSSGYKSVKVGEKFATSPRSLENRKNSAFKTTVSSFTRQSSHPRSDRSVQYFTANDGGPNLDSGIATSASQKLQPSIQEWMTNASQLTPPMPNFNPQLLFHYYRQILETYQRSSTCNMTPTSENQTTVQSTPTSIGTPTFGVVHQGPKADTSERKVVSPSGGPGGDAVEPSDTVDVADHSTTRFIRPKCQAMSTGDETAKFNSSEPLDAIAPGRLSPIWWATIPGPDPTCNLSMPSIQLGPSSSGLGEVRSCDGHLMIHILRLGPGQDLRSSLEHYIVRRRLSGAFIITCCGSVVRARLRLANLKEHDYNGPFEIVSLVGTVSHDGSQHLHLALSDSDGCVVGGHLIGDSPVHATVELVIGVTGVEKSGSEERDVLPTGRIECSKRSGQHLGGTSPAASPLSNKTARFIEENDCPKMPTGLRFVRKPDSTTGSEELACEVIEN